MSEAESLGSSSGSDEIAFSQLLASVARPIPQPFVSSPWGSGEHFARCLCICWPVSTGRSRVTVPSRSCGMQAENTGSAVG